MSQLVRVEADTIVTADFQLKHNVNYMAYHDAANMKKFLENITAHDPTIASLYRYIGISMIRSKFYKII